LPSIFGRYDGKDASKHATKASAAHCAVLPYMSKAASAEKTDWFFKEAVVFKLEVCD
jgi:hypothetical protein